MPIITGIIMNARTLAIALTMFMSCIFLRPVMTRIIQIILLSVPPMNGMTKNIYAAELYAVTRNVVLMLPDDPATIKQPWSRPVIKNTATADAIIAPRIVASDRPGGIAVAKYPEDAKNVSAATAVITETNVSRKLNAYACQYSGFLPLRPPKNSDGFSMTLPQVLMIHRKILELSVMALIS